MPEVKPWLSQGIIADTTSYLNDWGINDILQDGVIDPSWTYEGMIGGFPCQVGSWPMWYNMDLLKAAGVNEVPKTIDELKAAVTALKGTGVEGICFSGADSGGGLPVAVIAAAHRPVDRRRDGERWLGGPTPRPCRRSS